MHGSNTEHLHGTTGGEGEKSSRPPWGSIVGIIVTATLVGVFLGRSFQLDAGDADPSGSDPAADLQAALDQNPDDADGWRALGQSQILDARRAGLIRGYLDAERSFDEAARIDPDNPDTLLGLALVNLGLHRFQDAESLAQRSHDVRPDDSTALAALFDSKIELGKYEEATGVIDQLLSIRPDVASLARLSYLRELEGDSNGALSAMLQAKTSAGGLPLELARIDALLGDLHFARGDVDLASQAYDLALSNDPIHTRAVVGQARILALNGQIDDAIIKLEEQVRRTSDPTTYIMLAELYPLVDRLDDARFSAAIIANLAEDEINTGLGLDAAEAILESSWGNAENGLRLAEILYSERGDNVAVAQSVAWALHRLDRSTEAVPYIEQALRLGSLDPQLRFHAAEIFFAAGDRTRAAEQLAVLEQTNPAFSAGHVDDVLALRAELE